MSLTVRLKSVSSASHSSAEKHPFLEKLVAGNLSAKTYVAFLVELESTYDALESNLERVPDLSNLANRFGLQRLEHIRSDISYFATNYNLDSAHLNSRSQYKGHLENLSCETPLGLVSHFYTRYLGDLSGGQILKRFVQKSLTGGSSEGTAFYQFDSVESPRESVARIKQELDSIPLSESQIVFLENECVAAFKLSESMFDAAMESEESHASEITTSV